MHFQVIVDSDIFLPLKMKNEIAVWVQNGCTCINCHLHDHMPGRCCSLPLPSIERKFGISFHWPGKRQKFKMWSMLANK